MWVQSHPCAHLCLAVQHHAESLRVAVLVHQECSAAHCSGQATAMVYWLWYNGGGTLAMVYWLWYTGVGTLAMVYWPWYAGCGTLGLVYWLSRS